MNRREFLTRSTAATLGVGLGSRSFPSSVLPDAVPESQASSATATAPTTAVLPGTAPLTLQGDLALLMVERIRSFLLHETDLQPEQRQRLWNRDYSSPENYERSIAPNRQSLRRMIGAVDDRIASAAVE